MILNGTNINHQEITKIQACLTISQLLLFNFRKAPIKENTKSRHNVQREPPLSTYIGMVIHSLTRSKRIINRLSSLGISPTYSRILKLEDELAASVCERFQQDGVVVPPSLKKGIFTIAAIDNIDHNPTSSTAKGSFHGTGISLFQFPDESAVARPGINIPPTNPSKTLLKSYAYVPCIAFPTGNIDVPLRILGSLSCIEAATKE